MDILYPWILPGLYALSSEQVPDDRDNGNQGYQDTDPAHTGLFYLVFAIHISVTLLSTINSQLIAAKIPSIRSVVNDYVRSLLFTL